MNLIPGLVSVVVPTYNRGAAIASTIESVLAQTLKASEFEIVIVDDGSTDDTWEFLQSAYANHPQIRLFRTPNGGVAKARNFGLEQARGEFTAYLDHDDLWKPSKLQRQRLVLEEKPEVGMVYSGWREIAPSGEEVSPALREYNEGWWQPAEGEVGWWTYMPSRKTFLRNPIISMSVPLMRTELVKEVGGFDQEMVPSDDWDFWLKLSRRTQFAYVAEPLVDYIYHDAQQHTNMEKATDSWLKIIKKHKVSLVQSPLVWLWQRRFRGMVYTLRFHSEAKRALFSRQMPRFAMLMLRQGLTAPLGLLSRQWLYLIYRAARFNTSPY